MQFLDRTGVGTLWSMCKTKFALAGHTHNYAGSGSPGGSANSAIGVVDYNQTGKTIQIGYSGTGITGDQIKYIAGYTDGSGNVNAKIKDVSKDALKSWLGLGILAYESNVDWSMISDIPTATTTQSGIMSAADKSKLNGIALGANNYTLPTASTDDFGGVRVSTSYEQYKNSPWPIYVNRDNKIYTDIRGLGNNGQNSVSYIELTEENTTTKYSNKRITLFYGEPYEQTIDLPKESGTLALTSDIPTKTSQLTNDSTFLTSADKYILPVASQNTLGGILSCPILGNNINLWPVTVSQQAVAYTNIPGLINGSNGDIRSIIVNDNNYSTEYSTTSIQKQNKSQGTSTLLHFPLKSGTLALMSDVSNSCRFNFVNSVAECKSNRINFLIFNEGYTINIDSLNDSVDGTILLIFTKVDVYIKNESKKWYHGENFINIGEQFFLNSGKLFLITIIEGAVHAFSIY